MMACACSAEGDMFCVDKITAAGTSADAPGDLLEPETPPQDRCIVASFLRRWKTLPRLRDLPASWIAVILLVDGVS